MLHKTKIEDYVVYKTMQFLQDDEYIECLSELIYNLQFTESTILPRLEDDLKVKEKEIENILSAVKKVFAQDTLLKELADLEKQRDDISLSIAKEKIECPIF